MAESDERPANVGTARRIATKVLGDSGARRIVSVKSRAEAAWNNSASSFGRANVEFLRGYKNVHRGGRCVIIGNGPSLNSTDLSLLKDEITFGLNRIYLKFDEIGFATTYHVVVNRLVVEQCADEFAAIDAPLFTTRPNLPDLRNADNTGFLNKLIGPIFSDDISKGIWEGATVTYVAMQIAFYMGFDEVVLVGVDHNFVSKGPAHKEVESEGADPNHFDPNYFGKGFRWQLPDLETSEIAYRLAKSAFESDNRSIVDATVGGKLRVFPKVELAEALGK